MTVTGLGRTTTIGIELPWTQLALVVGAATAAGLLAGLLPVRRTARLDVLNAIAAE